MTTLISHRYRYIFIHIPKNAGSSIQTSLMGCESMPQLRKLVWRATMAFGSGKQTVSFGRLNNRLTVGWYFAALDGHAHAVDLQDILPGRIFNKYFKFAIVRNPWDRCVSRYEYYRQVNKRRGVEPKYRTFEAFLDFDYQPQRKRISDADGNLLVDFVGRMESLDQDMSHVYETCGLPLGQSTIPKINRTERRGYREYYDDTTRELVRQKYNEDVVSFGYEF